MNKSKKFSIYLIATIMVIFGSVFTSCSKDKDELYSSNMVDPTEETYTQDSIMNTTILTRSEDGWERVSNSIKNAYYSAYATAKSNYNLEYCYITVGFNAAYNATNGTNLSSSTQETLYTLCSNASYATFYSYANSTLGKNHFISDITYFITNYHKPVVVYAKTNAWGTSNQTKNILTVWAVSDDYVRVTKISTPPTALFGDNDIITLTWDDLYSKAINASNLTPYTNKVANVAYMDIY